MPHPHYIYNLLVDILLQGGFLGSSNSKESACNAGDRFDPCVRKIPWKKEMETHFQYSCLENSVDRGAWWAPVLGVAKSRTQLND